MIKRSCALLIVTGLLAQAELHMITGAPTPKGADFVSAALWRVQGDGTVKRLMELASEEE